MEGEASTAELKAMIEGDLDKQWMWGGPGGRKGQDGYRKNSQEGKSRILEGGWIGVQWEWGLNEGRKDHVFG